jgi:hypothetical protein
MIGFLLLFLLFTGCGAKLTAEQIEIRQLQTESGRISNAEM